MNRNALKAFWQKRNIGFGLRFFMVFFALLVVMAWFFADRAFQYITVSIRQSAETTLVDLSQILATHLEQEVMANGEINTANFAAFLHQAMQRRFDADVYQFHKKRLIFRCM